VGNKHVGGYNRGMPDSSFRPSPPSWGQKFAHALRGFKLGIRGQSSFFVHFFVASVVIVAGFVLQVERWEWSVLVLCITVVLAAEMFNSSLEHFGRAVEGSFNPELGRALDIAAAAVLVTSIGAAIIGAIVFLLRLGPMFGWW
jgi:diacylglycerol kinase